MKNADMPAMPVSGADNEPANMESSYYEYHKEHLAFGLTKREMMAMHILSGLLAAPDMKDATPDQLTVASVLYADKLLQELDCTSK